MSQIHDESRAKAKSDLQTWDASRARVKSDLDTPDGRDRLLRAQLCTVSYLHYQLVLCPCAWITRTLNSNFLIVYRQHRSQKRALYLVMAMLLCHFVLPCGLARTFLKQDCGKHLENINVTGQDEFSFYGAHTQRVDEVCGVVLELQDFQFMARKGVFGFKLNLVVVVLCHYFIRVWEGKLNYLYFKLGRSFLPRVLFNGFGPCGTDSSLKSCSAWYTRGLSDRDAEFRFRTEGDDHFLAPFDIFVACTYVACNTLFIAPWYGFHLLVHNKGLASMETSGPWLGGLAVVGVGFGGVTGLLFLLDYMLGAGDLLTALVKEELRAYSPTAIYYDAQQHLNVNLIKGKVEHAAAIAKDLCEKEGIYEEEAEAFVNQIQTEGEFVLETIVRWCHQFFGINATGLCLKLHAAESIFAANEQGVAALALLDVPMLLMAYFDPSWKILSHFAMNGTNRKRLAIDTSLCCPLLPVIPATCLDGFLRWWSDKWKQDYFLQNVCISWPGCKLCMLQDGVWHIQTVEGKHEAHAAQRGERIEYNAPGGDALRQRLLSYV